MYAVVRETYYSPDVSIAETDAFQQFQTAHAQQAGYRGTLLTDLGGGRYVTVTLWDSEDAMTSARGALGPIVAQLLEPLMTKPSTMVGAGRVAFEDVSRKAEGR